MRYAVLFIATLGMAAEATAPVIPASVEAEYYRADGIVAHMQPAWESANADLQRAVENLKKACGDSFLPSPADKRLICVAAPKPPPVEAPKK